MGTGFTDDERRMIAAAWPLELLEDPSRLPRILGSAEEFRRELLVGEHLEDVLVLPGGLEALGLTEKDALPLWLTSALDGAKSVLEFLRRLDKDALALHKAALEYIDEWGTQREALPRPYPYCLWDDPESAQLPAQGASAPGALPEAWRDLRQRLHALEGLARRGEVDTKTLYACEMRRLRERDANCKVPGCAGDESTKSLSLRHARDWFGPDARWSLYWNCYDDGLFVGGAGSGKGLHVDQVLWSNVGKNWRGYKLLAVWPAGEVSSKYVASLSDAHFRPPLAAEQRQALEAASKLVLLRPGDIFLCSGGVAHTTLCISEELSVTAYESLVTLHPRHVAHFLRTGTACGPDRGVMEAEELRDLRRGAARRLLALLETEQQAGRSEDPLHSQLQQYLAAAARMVAAEAVFGRDVSASQLLHAAEALESGEVMEVKRRRKATTISDGCMSKASAQPV